MLTLIRANDSTNADPDANIDAVARIIGQPLIPLIFLIEFFMDVPGFLRLIRFMIAAIP